MTMMMMTSTFNLVGAPLCVHSAADLAIGTECGMMPKPVPLTSAPGASKQFATARINVVKAWPRKLP
eukprot:8972026-Lingulodinium_polyedra.AAC.1